MLPRRANCGMAWHCRFRHFGKPGLPDLATSEQRVTPPWADAEAGTCLCSRSCAPQPRSWGGALARCTSASGQTLPSSVPKLASALRRSSPKADVPLSATSRRSSASRPSRPFGPVLAGAESGRWRGLRIPRREERRFDSRGPMVGLADWNLGYGAQVWAPTMRPNPGGGGRRSSGSPPYLGSLVSALSQSDSRCWRTARSKPVHEHSRYQLHPARSRPSGRLRYGQGARDVAPEHAREVGPSGWHRGRWRGLGYAAREPGLFALPQRLSRRNERLDVEHAFGRILARHYHFGVQGPLTACLSASIWPRRTPRASCSGCRCTASSEASAGTRSRFTRRAATSPSTLSGILSPRLL